MLTHEKSLLRITKFSINLMAKIKQNSIKNLINIKFANKKLFLKLLYYTLKKLNNEIL